MADNCLKDAQPIGKADLIKNPPIFNLNYTSQDFWSLKARLVDYIKQNFGDDFTDFVESSLAMMLIENWAFLADTLSFKMDQIVNELFIDTVTEVENAFRLSKLVGLKPVGPIGSSSRWTVTLTSPLTTDLVITTPVRISTVADGRPLSIELFPGDSDNNPIYEDDIILSAGDIINANIIGIEGKTIEDVFNGTGAIGQTLSLPETPVIFKSIRVDVDGVRWTEVDYFTDSNPRKEYIFEYDSEFNGFIIFGNNRSGMIPSTGSEIKVTYRAGGGTSGNIVAGYVEYQTNFPITGFNYSIPATFRNYTNGKYGYIGDGIEDIRKKLPPYLRTQNRAVTGSDYKTIAEQFVTDSSGQIGKAASILRNHGCAGNIIDIYVLAKGSGDIELQDASDGLKVALNKEMDEKKMLTDFVCIRDGDVLLADVSIDCVVDKFYKKFVDEYRQRVLNRVNEFFSLALWEMGDDLKETNLIKDIADIKQINSYSVEFTTDDESNSGSLVTTKYYEVIRPGTITITFTFE
jgi:hypothetical protein